MRIKICGITRPEDAVLAAQLGADAVGLNFYPGSPRHIHVAQAQAILRALPSEVERVGVFVQPTASEIVQVAGSLGLSSFQFHHANPADLSGALRSCGGRVILAHGIAVPEDLLHLRVEVDRWSTQGSPLAAVLIDARVPGQHGGTGKTAPWRLLEGFDPGVPVILAGGLNPDNVAEAIERVRPHAVDVASGVESAPGIKDPEKLRRFIDNARPALARVHAP